MDSIYQELAKLEGTGQSGVLCTIVFTQGSTPRREGSKMLVYPSGSVVGTIGGGELENRVVNEALKALVTGKPCEVEYSMNDPNRGDPGVCGGELRVFIEPIMPLVRLIIIGCGHVGKEVAHLGKWLGFYVIVCDDRPEACNSAVIPEADECHIDFHNVLEKTIQITPWTFVVLTTRDVNVDVSILPEILTSEAAYIGVIGSHRRWATTSSKLLKLGIDQEKLNKIHTPIGLNLNAETPREIALSIMAEILLVQKQGEGESRSA